MHNICITINEYNITFIYFNMHICLHYKTQFENSYSFKNNLLANVKAQYIVMTNT